MSYFDDASLVMIPSGYKDQKVYSVKPIDGSGDLTFSRASNATRVNSSGLVEKVRTNLITYSQDFSNAAWTKSGTTSITATGVTDPNGGTTAVTVSFPSLADEMYQQAGGLLTGEFTNSWYVKGTAGETIAIWALGASYELKTLTGAWQRVSHTSNLSSNTAYVAIGRASSGATATSVSVAFAQGEMGVMTDYIATTSSAVSVGPVSGLPRLDYSGGASCPSALLEPQRTNSITSSESTATGWTFTNSSSAVNQTASPDGYVNADSIIPDATSGQHAINSANITASGSFTLSAFVKAGEHTKVAIRESANTGSYASFNLATGTKIEDNVSGASFIQSYGNGWYRIGVTGTFSGTIRLGINVLSNAYTTGNPSSGTTFFAGNGTDKLFCWGMQCELGATYASSYINTLSTAVTRVADAASKTGISSLIGQTEGTIYWEGVRPEGSTDFSAFSVSDGSTNNEVVFRFTSADTIEYYLRSGGGQTVGGTYTGADLNQNTKIAFAYKANDAAVYVNGTLVNADTSVTVPVSLTALKFARGNDSTPMVANVKQAILFKTRLSNADLATLTTI